MTSSHTPTIEWIEFDWNIDKIIDVQMETNLKTHVGDHAHFLVDFPSEIFTRQKERVTGFHGLPSFTLLTSNKMFADILNFNVPVNLPHLIL